jgi:hypothetical protein
MIFDPKYCNDAYGEAEMERRADKYFDDAYGESRRIPWYYRYPVIPASSCRIDDYPDGTRRR